MISIENSKQNSLERLLFALGIRYVGNKTAKIIARHYQNIDNLIKTTYEELMSIRDIGDKIAKSIIAYFQDQDNSPEVLRSNGKSGSPTFGLPPDLYS